MKNQNDETETSKNSTPGGNKQLWRKWQRYREQTVGKPKPKGAFRPWEPVGEPFGDDQIANNEWWINKNKTADHEYEIRPEPIDDHDDDKG